MAPAALAGDRDPRLLAGLALHSCPFRLVAPRRQMASIRAQGDRRPAGEAAPQHDATAHAGQRAVAAILDAEDSSRYRAGTVAGLHREAPASTGRLGAGATSLRVIDRGSLLNGHSSAAPLESSPCATRASVVRVPRHATASRRPWERHATGDLPRTQRSGRGPALTRPAAFVPALASTSVGTQRLFRAIFVQQPRRKGKWSATAVTHHPACVLVSAYTWVSTKHGGPLSAPPVPLARSLGSCTPSARSCCPCATSASAYPASA
jgi:hypothetical protein